MRVQGDHSARSCRPGRRRCTSPSSSRPRCATPAPQTEVAASCYASAHANNVAVLWGPPKRARGWPVPPAHACATTHGRGRAPSKVTRRAFFEPRPGRGGAGGVQQGLRRGPPAARRHLPPGALRGRSAGRARHVDEANARESSVLRVRQDAEKKAFARQRPRRAGLCGG